MHNNLKTIDFSYPENIQLIDQAFDLFEWEIYPKDTLSEDEINDFCMQAAYLKQTNCNLENLPNPYAVR